MGAKILHPAALRLKSAESHWLNRGREGAGIKEELEAAREFPDIDDDELARQIIERYGEERVLRLIVELKRQLGAGSEAA